MLIFWLCKRYTSLDCHYFFKKGNFATDRLDMLKYLVYKECVPVSNSIKVTKI